VAFTPESGGFYVGDLFHGVDVTCQSRHAQLILVQYAVSWGEQVLGMGPTEDYLRIAADHRDGYVALTSIMSADDLKLFGSMRGPAVAIGGQPVQPGGATVIADNVGGAAAAVEHLIAHGHRRIGFVGAMSQFDVRQRYESYLATLRRARIEPDPDLCYAVVDDLGSGGAQAVESIMEAGIPLTAVFVSTDTQGILLMERLAQAGVRVPEDVAVVGFDDSQLTQTAVPALTSVRQSPARLGSTAATLLLDALDGGPEPSGVHLVPTHLIERHSCGCYTTQRHLFDGDTDWLRDDWRERLARVLTLALEDPTGSLDESNGPEREWPSVHVVIDALEDSINGRRIARIGELDAAWFEASLLTPTADTLMRIVDLLEFVALCRQQPGARDSALLGTGLQDFLAQSRLQILRYAANVDPGPNSNSPPITRDMLRRFLEPGDQKRQSIDWLAEIGAVAGCLALWEPGPDERARLRVESLYGKVGATQGGVSIQPELFPPRDWLDACRIDGEPCAVMVLPIDTPRRRIGVIAAAVLPDQRYYSDYWNLQYAASLLALVLERREAATDPSASA